MADENIPGPLPEDQLEALRGLIGNAVPPDQVNNLMNGLLGILQQIQPPLPPPPPPPPVPPVDPPEDEDPLQDQPEDDNIVEKKKPKLAKLTENSRAPDQLQPLYPRYAMERLRKMEYVELWYFTPEGRSEERFIFTSAADDALGLARIGGQVTLKPFATIQPSKKAVSDKELTWLNFSMAYPNLIAAMREAEWEEPYVVALADFFLALAHHDLTFQPDGFDALLLHQAEVRLAWHESLKYKKTAFNIANLNNTLLANHHRRVQDLALYRLRTQVCNSSPPGATQPPHLASSPPLFSRLLLFLPHMPPPPLVCPSFRATSPLGFCTLLGQPCHLRAHPNMIALATRVAFPRGIPCHLG